MTEFPYYGEYAAIAETTQALLRENAEWQERYVTYAEDISNNLDTIHRLRRRFREWSGLKPYLNVSNARQASRQVHFELRYLGQTVGELVCTKDAVLLDTSKFDVTNHRDFNCEVNAKGCAWAGKEASAFRKHFKQFGQVRNLDSPSKNEEHRIESLLLTEFSKAKEKALPYIKPVTIGELRFPMPTPLSASNHGKVKYADFHGGGIDLLARTGTGGRATYLCVIEIKDENTPREPAKDALEQAIVYTVFLRELLRSKAGEAWWKLFGFGGGIPKKLTLYSACAMPVIANMDTSFRGGELPIGGQDSIKLHYIYFNEADNQINKIYTSLPTGKEPQ